MNYPVDLHIDPRGNVYTLGLRQYLSEWLYGCDTCLPTQAYTSKIDFNGSLVWSRREVRTCPDGFRGRIATDSAGATYFTEEHWVDFWNLACPNYNTGTLTVSLYPDGRSRWSSKFGISPSLYAGPATLLVSRAGRVYVASYNDVLGHVLLIYANDGNSLTVTSVPFSWNTTATLIEDNHGNILAYSGGVAKFRPDGFLLGHADVPYGVSEASIDRLGNSYCLTGGEAQNSLIKFDSNLTPRWSVNFVPLAARLCIEPGGSSVVWSETFAAKFDSNGDQEWRQEWFQNELKVIDGAVDELGRIFSWSIELGYSDTVGSVNSYDTDGNFRWDSREIGISYSNRAYGGDIGSLHLDSRGDIYVMSRGTSLTIEKFTQPKTFVIRDAEHDSIPNSSLYLIRVHNNPPDFDEDTLGQFTTDVRGLFHLPFAGSVGYIFQGSPLNPSEDTLKFGDTLKIARLVSAVPAVRHAGVLGTPYSIHLDNGDFLSDGRLVFDTLELGSIQTITLEHTEYRYNLLVSLEWDAEESYIQGLTADFKQMSNYLYDVSDGQIRLDTVVILDDRSLWDEADVQINASNVYWPNAGVAGIAWTGFPPINLPRKWFGDADSCRVFSYVLHPLTDEVSDSYRTMAHEMGHYGLSFYDEYLFADPAGNPLPDASRCLARPDGNYGFMDYQYDDAVSGGLRASEMSSEYRYQNGACQNTLQWVGNGRSCWDDFEHWAEGVRNGIYVPILKPSLIDSTERITPTGLDYFPGPNDDLYNLDYDVGRLVHFPAAVLPPDPSIHSVHLKVDTVAPGGLNVQLLRWGANPMYQIDQGATTDNGHLWVLGMDFYQDEILVAGSSRTESLAMKSAGARAVAHKTWMCGSVRPGSSFSRTRSRYAASAAGDSVELSLRPVAGDYPMVCDGQFSDNGGWTYGLWFEHALSQAPQLDIITDQGDFASSIFTVGTDSYGSEVAGYLTVPGKATVWAVDDSSNTFFFSTPYEVMEITTPRQLQKLIGPAGESVVRIDSSNSGIQRVLVLSSAYPVPMNGLDPNAIQAGRTHALSTYPTDVFLGSNSISLNYSDSDLRDQNGSVLGDDTSLRIFRWNRSALQWELVGGYADTALNTVTASISQSGVYAAFTTVVTCCNGRVGDANGQGTYPQEVTIGDILTIVTAKYISALPCEQTIPCLAEADVNQSGGADPKCSDVTMADIQTLVNHLFIAGPANAPLKICL